MVSVYSVFSAVVFYNLGLVTVYVLMRKTRFVINYTTASLSLLTLLATIRLFIPADFSPALVIKSTRIIPAVQNFLAYRIYGDFVSVGVLLALAWGLGTLFYLARDIFLFAAAKRTEAGLNCVKSERVRQVAEELGLRCRIIVSPDICEPYCSGILKPTIYLPDWELSQSELRIVLGHEYAHIRSFDSIKKLVFLLLEGVFWWNPISHVFRREFNQLIEIQCDFRLTKDKGEAARLQYAETLVSVMKHITKQRKNSSYSCPLTNNRENMRQRFELILYSRKAKIRYTKALLYIALVFAFVFSYFVIAQPYYEPPMLSIDGVCIVDDGNSFILKEGEDYALFYNGEKVDTVSKDELTYQVAKALPIYNNTNNKP